MVTAKDLEHLMNQGLQALVWQAPGGPSRSKQPDGQHSFAVELPEALRCRSNPTDTAIPIGCGGAKDEKRIGAIGTQLELAAANGGVEHCAHVGGQSQHHVAVAVKQLASGGGQDTLAASELATAVAVPFSRRRLGW